MLQGTSLCASISERRPVSNYRCFGTFPQVQKTQPAGDGGEPTSAIACLEQEPVEWASRKEKGPEVGPLLYSHDTCLAMTRYSTGPRHAVCIWEREQALSSADAGLLPTAWSPCFNGRLAFGQVRHGPLFFFTGLW